MTSAAPAVILGLSPTGLYAVRELGRAGVPILGVGETDGPATASRFMTLGAIVERDPAVRLQRLMERAGKARPVLIPTSDQDTEFITKNAAVLAERFVFQKSFSDGLADIWMTKAAFYELARSHGLMTPQSWSTPRACLGDLAGEVTLPCLIKPSRIHDIKQMMAGKKAWIAKDSAAFDALVRDLPPGGYELVVQEIVPGPESEITLWCAYVDRAGTVREAFTARKVRQFPPGFGSASLVVSNPEPDTRAAAEHLVTAAGWRGVVAAEFKRHPADGGLRIIEMNPRASLWFACATAADKLLVRAAYADLTGATLPKEQPQRDGVVWRYGTKDAYSAAFYRLNKDFVLPPPDLRLARNAVRRVGAVWANDDLGPYRADILKLARKGLARLTLR